MTTCLNSEESIIFLRFSRASAAAISVESVVCYTTLARENPCMPLEIAAYFFAAVNVYIFALD